MSEDRQIIKHGAKYYKQVCPECGEFTRFWMDPWTKIGGIFSGFGVERIGVKFTCKNCGCVWGIKDKEK